MFLFRMGVFALAFFYVFNLGAASGTMSATAVEKYIQKKLKRNDKILRINEKNLGDSGLAVLARSPIVRSVRTLVLYKVEITDKGVRALSQSPNLKNLEYLHLEHNFITARIENLVKWSRARSCWPATFGLACCAIEMMATGAAHYDLARYGMEVFRASPRQADLMIVAGRVSQKMAPILRQIYDQMMEPKWVISMGVCASSGGMFNNYAIVQGVDQVVPVDVYAPGCPPGPETLMNAILTLHEKIETGELTRRRKENSGGAAIEITGSPTEIMQPVELESR